MIELTQNLDSIRTDPDLTLVLELISILNEHGTDPDPNWFYFPNYICLSH